MQRLVVLLIAAVGIAAMCNNTDARLLSRTYDVVPTAAIDESATTAGLADSNLMRLKSHAEIDKELDMMQSIGVENIRIGLYWAEIEPLKGRYNWSNADYIVNQANARGMGVLATINETPAWAGTPIGAGTPSTTDFSKYVTTVANRYKGKISAYEIWNEPNAKFFMTPVSPANYTELLKAGYTAIKGVDQSITVIGGVLGSGRTLTDDNGEVQTMNPVEYLAGMYDAGAHGYFDAISFHPYKYDMKYSEQQDQVASPLRQFQNMRAMMDFFGDTDKKIWASEYGLPTTAINGIGQQHQADYIEDFLNSWSKQVGAGPMFIYTTRDIATGGTNPGNNFGIWQTNWTPKLAVQVLQDYLGGSGVIPPDPVDPYPFITWVKNLITNGIAFVGNVITDVVDAAVAVTKAVVEAVAWAVETAVDVTVKVVKGLANATVKVVKAIGNAIQGAVDAVRNAIQRIFNRPASATAVAAAKVQGKLAPAAAEPKAAADTVDKTDKDAKKAAKSKSKDKPKPKATDADKTKDADEATDADATKATDEGKAKGKSKSKAKDKKPAKPGKRGAEDKKPASAATRSVGQ